MVGVAGSNPVGRTNFSSKFRFTLEAGPGAMKRKLLSFQWIWILLLVAWCLGLSRPLGPLPALGPLFDFQSGVWRHHDFKWHDQSVKGLKHSVVVAIDASGVPHLFAQSESDLYLAQGYVNASQRLFQMDLSTRAASGELANLVGKRVLKLDRFFVKFGMRQSENETLKEIMSEPKTAAMLNSFTMGVNSYIDALKELPVEYKILSKSPLHFDNRRVVAMDKAMTFSLNGRADDFVLSHLQLSLSTEKILDLFPEFYPEKYEEFIFPKVWNKRPRDRERPELFSFRTHLRDFPSIPQPSLGNGSNNWVVGPLKSKTGHTILANDTHLDLTLPNVWVENQLSCPEFNVYGVSLPAVPGIINGFNSSIAWGPTNGATDALDYYEVEFENETSLTYKDGEKSRVAQVYTETIGLGRDGFENVPVTWTKWGAVLHREGRYGLVANWTGHRASNELLALRRLYPAVDVKGCLSAFSDWKAPIQNFVCADANHFALIHAGFIPERNVGEGRFISSPELTRSALTKAAAEDERPQMIDSKEGFLRSANQRVVGPSYSTYMGTNYEEPFRAKQIRRRLEQVDKLSGEDMIAIQNDDFDPEAELILPILLRELNQDKLSEAQREQMRALGRWDLHDSWDRVEPTIYEAWYHQVKEDLFSDEYDLPERLSFRPKDIRTAWLLERVSKDPHDSDSYWVDDKRTSVVESLTMIVTQAFLHAWSDLEKKGGSDAKAWIWKNAIQTKLSHVAKLPGFGSDTLEMSGASDSVRGNRGWHGAVYKFVIELGPEQKAWMQVPGGLSGDPFSTDYERGVKEWSQGVMRPVEFYKNLDEARKRAVQVVELRPEAG